ncbi:hypothetical protein QYE76_058168 [Lolium multiflorum]|uniref:Uncharacterized protein n=1 Tax=Lolium multiflorum TaxID=4521 RepID=A0AAD8T5P5_LOLMU|nr:hypothetical protein QYE76_058168 [Lolium multiflorum]
MKMAVKMAAVSMEKPSGALPRVREQRLLSPDLGFAMTAALEGFWGFRRDCWQHDVVFGRQSSSHNFFPDLSDFFDNLNMGDNDAAQQINSSSVAAATRPPLFDGMHYKRWRTKAVLWFTNLGCFSATDARPEGPLSAEEQEKFEKVDAIFKAALFSILGDNIVGPYMAFDHGKDAWDALEAKFGVSDAGTELYVMEQYYDYRMTDERWLSRLMRFSPLPKNSSSLSVPYRTSLWPVALFQASSFMEELCYFYETQETRVFRFGSHWLVHVEEKARAKDTRARSFEGGRHDRRGNSGKSANVVIGVDTEMKDVGGGDGGVDGGDDDDDDGDDVRSMTMAMVDFPLEEFPSQFTRESSFSLVFSAPQRR